MTMHLRTPPARVLKSQVRLVALACVVPAVLSACDTQTTTEDPCHSGAICTYAGTGTEGFNGDGKDRLDSLMYWPADLTFDAKGTAFILDWNNYRVRRVKADGTLETIIGTDFPGDGDPGKLDMTDKGAPGTTVSLNHPSDLMFATKDSAMAKAGDLILVAWHNHRLRVWDPATSLVFAHCGAAPGFAGDGKPASTTTKFNQPSKMAQDAAGNSYIIDMRNWRIRKVAVDGMVSTIAGTGKPGFDAAADTGPLDAKKASFLFFNPNEFSNPGNAGGGLAISADGKILYVADTMNHRIRAMDLAAGTITTLAGTGGAGCVDLAKTATGCVQDGLFPPSAGSFDGDGGPALQAHLNQPHDLAFGPDGDLYFADSGNHRVRAIHLATGVIRTVAGNGKESGDLGDGGGPLKASLSSPWGIAFDPQGNLFIADTFHHRIRKITR
jgi:uncharacterized ParB-like nuclease family protein